MNKNTLVISNVIFPMLIGGFIYIFFREPSLLMFKWFDYLQLNDFIFYLREEYLFNLTTPDWIIYNLPDGIWIYSLTSLMLIVWNNHKSSFKYFWILVGPLLGISAEICQYFYIISGTFDIIDLIFCIVASILPFIVIYKYEKI